MRVGMRIFLGLVLVLAGVGFGAAARSPVVIAPLSVIFTLSFALGRWRAWRAALQAGALLPALRAQWSTALVQVLLVVLLYLLGRGFGAMTGLAAPAAFGSVDALALWGVAIVVLCGGAGLALLEAQGPVAQAAAEPAAPQAFAAVTETSFFTGHHYSNTANSVPDPALAFLTEAQITEAEARLGVVLPQPLRALYLRQNGGPVGGLVSPRVPNPSAEEDWITPFSGYDDLSPLRFVRSLQSSIEDYADPQTQPEMFPAGADRMIALAQWYRETLFLDYRTGGAPRVGFFDFDRSEDLRDAEWQDRAVWWSDFDAFFASLRRPAET
ncbi:SMI1/KNR4 family protein [Pseudorhodobacter sp. E13]|uniref:SMI1/KNR4 family protein n=1 Tax=Pseudorhodobacter sp. E13 TaxID=2487931 RepID=UPI000F8D243F|nr:SMI1/KNR4 family protein [Pseudorhodobacter sp. E13]RUS63576.1 SMI1/KNR4 family protein [Pseudorhodobacter sp. E13]